LGQPLAIRAETLRRCMEVAFILRHRKTLGGPGRSEVLRMLRGRRALLAREREWLSARQEVIDRARRLTDSLARRIMRKAGEPSPCAPALRGSGPACETVRKGKRSEGKMETGSLGSARLGGTPLHRPSKPRRL